MAIPTKQSFQKYTEQIKCINLSRTIDWLLSQKEFFLAPAASKKHQAYQGGLAEHSLEVLDIAYNTAQSFALKENIHLDIVICASIWHDFGKIWDYKQNPKFGTLYIESDNVDLLDNPDCIYTEPEYIHTRHCATVKHLVRSYHEFLVKADEFEVCEDCKESVSHAILSHHGRKEWGSPVEPLTKEALIVHQADCLSATDKENLFALPKDSDWHKFSTKNNQK